MKRSFLGCLITSVFALLAVLLAPAIGFAQTTFTVNIPRPAPGKLPIDRVRVELTVGAGTIPMNPTLTITHNGAPAGVISPGGFHQDLDGGGPNRSEVLFQTNAASNRVIISLHPYDNLRVDPGDPTLTQLCVENNAPAPLDPDVWTFTYNGPATEHRFNSYTGLSSTIGLGCGCETRRLGTSEGAATVTFSLGGGTNAGRLPIDFALVLDKSGSMDSTIPPANTETKMQVLRPAVQSVIDTLISEGGSPRDRLALVWFESAVNTLGFVSRTSAGPNTWATLRDGVTTEPTGNMTAMGDAFSKAIDLYEQPDPIKSDLAVVVLTDGMQNEGNLIKNGELVLPVPAPSPEPGRLAFFRTSTSKYETIHLQCKPVQTIGVGVAGASYVNLMNQLASETRGTSYVNLGSTMDLALMDATIETLKGNTLTDVIPDVEATLSGGSASSAPVPFQLSNAVKRAIVILNWKGPANGLQLQIKRPGGAVVSPPAEVHNGNVYTVQSVDLPANGPAGQWSATVLRAPGNTTTTPYHLSVIAVEGRFSLRMAFNQINHGTGEPVTLTAELADNNTRLTGLGNSINVRVERPQIALGSFMRSVNSTAAVLSTNPPGHSVDSFPNPYARKLFSMLQDPTFVALLKPKLDPRTFTLFDDGSASSGDAVAGDGVYTMRLSGDDTKTPGVYRFNMAMDFDRPSTGRIVRAESRETEVVVKVADPDETEIIVTRSLGTPGEFTVDVIPADRFGNFMGPGYADNVRLTLSGGGSVTNPPVDKRENGTYTFTVTGVPSASTTIATLVVNGATVKTASLIDIDNLTKKWSVWGAIGANAPHGDFNTFLDPGVSASAGLEFRFTHRVGIEGAFGYDRFSTIFGSNPSLYHLSANLKVYPVVGTFQLGIFGGGGVYVFDPGGNVDGGINIGVAPEYRINTSVSLEGRYNFHNVFTSGSHLRFSTVQGGVRFRF